MNLDDDMVPGVVRVAGESLPLRMREVDDLSAAVVQRLVERAAVGVEPIREDIDRHADLHGAGAGRR